MDDLAPLLTAMPPPEGLGRRGVRAEMTSSAFFAKQGGLHEELGEHNPLAEFMLEEKSAHLISLHLEAHIGGLPLHGPPEGILLAVLELLANMKERLSDRASAAFDASHSPTQLPKMLNLLVHVRFCSQV